MSQDEHYRQCRFEQRVGDRVTGQETAWIPEHGAVVGKRVQFLDEGAPAGVWTVVAVYERQSKRYLTEHQMAYRHQREMSDI